MSFYSNSQLALESIEIAHNHNIRAMELLKEQKRAASLELFLAEDAVCLIKTKKHLKLTNEIVGPLFLEEDDSLDLWRCFGRAIPQKSNNLKRRNTMSVSPDAPAAKVFSFSASAPEFIPQSGTSSRTSSGFSIHAAEFIPRSVSGSTTPTSSGYSSNQSVSSTPTPKSSECSTNATSPTPLSGSFTFNIGTVNAPSTGSQTRKHHLDDDAFVMVASEATTKPRRIKVFTQEELQRQQKLVEEFRRNVLNSC